MAIIKSISSRASIAHAINYITKKEKTDVKLIGGYGLNPKTAIEEMNNTKKYWDKESGRQYKHFIQSFSKEENITPLQAHNMAFELISTCNQFENFEVCFATHKDREHIHTHFIINSVNYENGKKYQQSKEDLQSIKNLSDKIIAEHGFLVCEKNKEITSFNMKTYKSVEKAVKDNYESWLLEIMKAINTAKSKATTIKDFCNMLNINKIEVVWNSNRSSIVFIHSNNKKVRDCRLNKLFKTEISKEKLEDEFTRNRTTRSEKSINQANGNKYTYTGECSTERSIEQLHQRFRNISNADEELYTNVGNGDNEQDRNVTDKQRDIGGSNSKYINKVQPKIYIER